MRRVLGLLRAFSLPYLRAHPMRVALTAIGVALGVTTYVAVQIVADGLVESFRTSVRTVAGESELQVSSPAGVSESTIERVARVPGVDAAAGLVEAFVPLARTDAETAYLLGVDFLASPVWRAQFPRDALDVPDELAFLAQTDSVMVPHAFATTHGLALGDPLAITTPAGRRVLHVRGILADVAVSRLFGSAVLVMDLPAALRQLGRGTIDRVLVDVADGADLASVRGNIARELGPGLDVAPPEERGAQADQLLSSLRAMLETASATAGIVGAFIVFHAVLVSIRQRRRALALGHTVGLSPRALAATLMLEATGIGAVGLVAGLWLGRVLATSVGAVVGTAASDIWVRVDMTTPSLRAGALLPAVMIGMGAAVVATAVALRLVRGVSTVEALGTDDASPDDRTVRPMSALRGVALVAATFGLALVPVGRSTGEIVFIVDLVNAMAIAGTALLAPAVVVAVGLAMNRATRRVRWLPLRLATAGLPRRPASGGATVATIVAAASVTVTLAVLVQSFQGAWIDWLEQHFGADLFVGAGGHVRLMAGPAMDGSIGERLARVPGVASVEPFRVRSIELAGRQVFLQAVSTPDRLAHGGLAMVEGTLAGAAPEMAAGRAVLVSDNLAYRAGLRVGDRLALPAPDGTHDVRVAGTYTDFLGSLDLGAVAVDAGWFRRTWGDDSANLYRLWLTPGARLDGVRRSVTASLPSDAGYYTLSGRDFVDAIRNVLRAFFAAGWAIQAVTAIAGIVGVVNAQVISVMDRRRELATLRAVGISPRTLGRSIMLECGALGASGAVLGVLVGLVLSIDLLWFTMRLLTGWRIPMQIPAGQLVAGCVFTALVAGLAGAVPARLARRISTGSRSIE